MGLDEARRQVAGHPGLGTVVRDDWLVAESAKGRGHWHPLYDWLEAPEGYPGAGEFLAALESALTEPLLGRVQSRRRRLVADPADYWSALCELYLATCLHQSGLEVTLGDPDVIVAADGEDLAIELTAFQRTGDLNRLVGMLTDVWRGPGAAILEADDWEARLTRTTAEAVVAAFQGAAAAAEPDGRVSIQLPTEAASVLTASIEPGDACVHVGSGASWGFPQTWPDIESVVRKKRRQVAGHTHGVVAVEMGHADPENFLWRVGLEFGGVPHFSTDPAIDGVLIYWQDVRKHCPSNSVFVLNANSTGVSPLLAPFLACARLRVPGPAGS